MIDGFEPLDLSSLPTMTEVLSKYADALVPWAKMTASKMIAEVNDRDRESWRSLGFAISQTLRNEILHAPLGDTIRELLDDQVDLIRSLPIEAAQRVHELTLKGLEDSTRAAEFAKEIRRSGQVTDSRATLIARTEVSRTASVLVQGRCAHVGLLNYHWRTSMDGDVRPGHREMQDKVCEWAKPPAVDENGRIMHFHAGQIWNCRCWPEPIISIGEL